MKKKRKKKQKPVENLWEFEITFTDVTMAEADGNYKIVKRLMEEAPPIRVLTSKGSTSSFVVSNLPAQSGWTIHTRLTILSPLGEGHMTLNLNHDGKIYIVDYMGNTSTIYNPDIRCLCTWAQQAGWQIPEPTESLIKDAPIFWKQMWDTTIVDSEYLDKKYGIRPQIAMRDGIPPEPEDEEDELENFDE